MKALYKALIVGVLLIPFSMSVSADEDDDKSETNIERLRDVQDHLLTMHDLSTKILAEKDPKKQKVLKDQQLELMKAHMAERKAKRQEHRKQKEQAGKK